MLAWALASLAYVRGEINLAAYLHLDVEYVSPRGTCICATMVLHRHAIGGLESGDIHDVSRKVRTALNSCCAMCVCVCNFTCTCSNMCIFIASGRLRFEMDDIWESNGGAAPFSFGVAGEPRF